MLLVDFKKLEIFMIIYFNLLMILINKLNNLDVLVVNALRIEHHYSHFNLEQALEFIKIVKPKKAYLTHISHMLGFHDEVQKILPENVFLAYDGLEITV